MDKRDENNQLRMREASLFTPNNELLPTHFYSFHKPFSSCINKHINTLFLSPLSLSHCLKHTYYIQSTASLYSSASWFEVMLQYHASYSFASYITLLVISLSLSRPNMIITFYIILRKFVKAMHGSWIASYFMQE